MKIVRAVSVSIGIVGCALASLATLAAAQGTATAPAAAVAVGPEGLPLAPGRDAVLKVCTSCHETGVIQEKRLSFADWDSLVQQMVSRGATATDAEVQQITDYLAASFPAG